MSEGLSENTQVKANMQFVIKVCVALATITMGYSAIVHRISDVENAIVRMQSDVEQNSEFRVKWPRGELGSLPDDAEQNLRLQYLEAQISEQSLHIDKLRHAN